MFADADALKFQVAGDIGYSHQAEVSGPAANVTHQNDVTGDDCFAPLPARPRGPRIKGRLRFLQQGNMA